MTACGDYLALWRDEKAAIAAASKPKTKEEKKAALRDQFLSRITVIGSVVLCDIIMANMQGDVEAMLEDCKENLVKLGKVKISSIEVTSEDKLSENIVKSALSVSLVHRARAQVSFANRACAKSIEFPVAALV